MKEQSELLRRSQVEQSYKPAPGSGASLWAFPGNRDELWSNSEFLRFQSFLLVDIEFSAKMVNESLRFAGESARSLKAIKICISFKRSYFSLQPGAHSCNLQTLYFLLAEKEVQFCRKLTLWWMDTCSKQPNWFALSDHFSEIQMQKSWKSSCHSLSLSSWLIPCSLLVKALSTKKHDVFLYIGKVSWQGNGRKSWT